MVLSYQFHRYLAEEYSCLRDHEHIYACGIFRDESEKRLPISLRDHGWERTECDQFCGNVDRGMRFKSNRQKADLLGKTGFLVLP